VAKLTVEQAYAQRQRKQTTESQDSVDGGHAEDVKRLRKSISSIGKRTEDVIHDAAFAAPEEALILIPAVRRAIGQLKELLRYLEQQAATAPAAKRAEKTESEETPDLAT